MQMRLALYFLLVSAAVFSFAGAFAAWRRRSRPSALPLAVLSVCAGFWAIFYLLELSSATLQAKTFWGSIKYPFVALAPVALAVFWMRFAGWHRWPGRHWLVALLIVPLVTVLIAFTNDFHRLFWADTTLAWQGDFLTRQVRHGAWFWIHTGYSYLLMVTSTLVALTSLSHLGRMYRRQFAWVAMCLALPLVVNLLTVLGVPLLPGIDLSSVAFGVSVLLLAAFGLDNLLSVVPMAHASLVEQMRDGVLILDMANLVLDVNPAGLQALGLARSDVVGKNLRDLDHPMLRMLPIDEAWDTQRREVKAGPLDLPRWYEMTASRLTQPGRQVVGRMVVWHDITERKQTEARLRYASTHDSLTGLYNRLFLDEEIERLRAGRVWPVTVLVADLDNLKATNDHHGHAYGDEALRRAADLLRQSLRSGDLAARIGGDEFAMLLPGCDENGAEIVMQRVEQVLLVYNSSQAGAEVKLSLGYAVAWNRDQLEQALQDADVRMYAAKNQRKAVGI
jgi:diguanylate cyclase (GGDEF)-like protein/PAS domain S-box-containing protein